LPFRKKDSFRLLQIGSGLGADLKAARSLFPGCEPVGYEPDKVLFEIAKNTENVYNLLPELAGAFPGQYFDALIIDPELIGTMSGEDKRLIAGLCRESAPLFSKNAVYENFPYDRIKLIAWDMDDTFWQGIISEGEVLLSSLNVELIKSLTDHGIMNSISSKNDEEPVCRELTEAGIWEYFVFNQINWDEKGDQLAAKLKAMGLRAENTLFIDDNPRNLEQAKMSSPGLMTAGPEIIPYLYTYYSKLPPKDISHDRLNQYKLLEKKVKAEVLSTSKEQFLFDSDIRVSVNRNCLEELDRIHELVSRTNQLNYTKNRDNKELLTRLITNDWNDCAYLRVRDRFGDYGIVGFYCYNKRERKLEHFLFSCRVLGMGIEQYAYNLLGCPDFTVKGKIAIELSKDKEVPWIKEDHGAEVSDDKLRNNRVRVLLKGPCDMSAIEPYLSGGNITTEFNYINEQGFATTGQNHTMHIYESAELSKKEIVDIVNDVPFIIQGDFETKLFSEEYHVICLSLLQDLSAGLYENKETGAYISFSSRNFDLTSLVFKDRFIKGEIQGHEFPFTGEIIDRFREKWDFVGATPFELLLRNLDYIYDNVKGEPIIILLLGSETDYEGYSEEFAGLCDVYREINPVIKAFAEDHERMRVIDPTEFIHSQADFEDCINHFSRNVYYEIAGRICEYINEAVDRISKR
ncbi:MAG: HAD-IIIC family phosphatase, partial [Lachnospiraceae bacterium]|nr:HAD-IIIC family phosphatase [Lachnospiraceae bacterium]